MKTGTMARAGLALMIAAAAPAAALAQAAPADPAAAQAPAASPGRGDRDAGDGLRRGVFRGLSDEGRAIVRGSLRQGPSEADRQAMQAARQRVLTLLAAEPLDVDAVRQAQAEERRLAQKNHQERQEALLGAYQKLSAADRQAFIAGMREMDQRMSRRMERAREHMGRKAAPPKQPG